MKILMLHNRYLIPGGEDQSTAADVALLADTGHQVELVEQDNRDIERLGRTRTALRTVWSSDSFRRIREKLLTGGFDILHVQNFFPLWSPSVYYAAARCGIPVVQTLHNYRLLCVNSIFFRDNHVCEDCLGKTMPWPGIVHGCYRGSRAGSAVVAGMAGFHRMMGTWESKVQAYIAVSEFAREKYVAGGLPAEKISVRPNFLHPSPAPGRGGGGYALYAGRLSQEKGIATMLQAWKKAESAIPLKIIGEGPLRAMVAAESTASPSIEYMGPMPLEDVIRWMGGAEFLVFPSEWHETMGRTIMESFAVGTPVVAARLGAPASMVSPGRTGFHFKASDVDSLREQVEWCSRNPEEVRAMRNNCRTAFELTYTGAAAAASLLAIYRAAQGKAPAVDRRQS
jgi:glycosyltransferase involved in cell wall biosynthesis